MASDLPRSACLGMLQSMNITVPIFAALVLSRVLAAAPAHAQNTADDWKWVVDHFKVFGLWESACDHRDIGNGEERRCYVRVVDVYAPRPDFGAAFVFISRTAVEGLRFEFTFERGTEFEPGGFAIMQNGVPAFDYAPARCEAGTRCLITGEEAKSFAASLTPDASLRLAFTDKSGRHWERMWSGHGFAEALDDLGRQSARRGL
jgi:invasion protein IalB